MWKAFECSSQGRSHVKEEIPCQDKTFSLTYGDVTTIALADGAGSARLSHLGAECVTKVIAEELCSHFQSYWDESSASLAKCRLYQSIKTSLDALSHENSCDVRDLASTLLAVAAKGNKFILFHVGDGVIGYKDGSTLKVASTPNNGEFCNTTVFTTSTESESQTRLIKAQSDTIDGFILMSDGPESCLYSHKDNVLASGLLDMFDDASSQPAEIVNANINETMQDTIIQRTFDDCSIALLVKSKEVTEMQNLTTSDLDREEAVLSEHIQLSDLDKTDYEPSQCNEGGSRKYLFYLCVLLIIVSLLITFMYE